MVLQKVIIIRPVQSRKSHSKALKHQELISASASASVSILEMVLTLTAAHIYKKIYSRLYIQSLVEMESFFTERLL
jgi:hypothetical protein